MAVCLQSKGCDCSLESAHPSGLYASSAWWQRHSGGNCDAV